MLLALTSSHDGFKPSHSPTTSVVVGDDVPLRRRNQGKDITNEEDFTRFEPEESKKRRDSRWKRILLLTVAVTVHNIPEGMAVGVGFGAIGKGSMKATFESARNLAIGIGIKVCHLQKIAFNNLLIAF